MLRVIALLVTLFASASAFAPATPLAVSTASKTVLSMAMDSPTVSKNVAAAVAGVTLPLLSSPLAAMATDGTGEWFGVDDLRLLGVLFIGHWFILSLWLGQYGDSDESEDFFGEIDYTKN